MSVDFTRLLSAISGKGLFPATAHGPPPLIMDEPLHKSGFVNQTAVCHKLQFFAHLQSLKESSSVTVALIFIFEAVTSPTR